MQASDVMTSEVVTVESDATLTQAVRMMLQYKISGLPVVDKSGNLVGILSEGDLLHRGELETKRKRSRWLAFFTAPGTLAEEYVKLVGRRIDELMTTGVVSVAPDTPLEEVVAMMESNAIKRLPVVVQGRVVGIITRRNLVRALGKVLSDRGSSRQDDAAIENAIRAEIAAQDWGPAPDIRVSVNDGVATLSGVIFDERLRGAIVVAAENTPGVQKVVDEILWTLPVLQAG